MNPILYLNKWKAGERSEPSEGHRRKGEESRLSWLWSEWTLVRVDLGGHSGIESSYKS